MTNEELNEAQEKNTPENNFWPMLFTILFLASLFLADALFTFASSSAYNFTTSKGQTGLPLRMQIYAAPSAIVNTEYNVTGRNSSISFLAAPSPPIAVHLRSLNITLHITTSQYANATLTTKDLTAISYIAPALPYNYTYLRLLNITTASQNYINPAIPISAVIDVTEKYDCLMASDRIVPFILFSRTWYTIVPYTVNSSACTISFTISGDPIVALAEFLGKGEPQPITSTVSTTSTLSSSTSTTTANIVVVPTIPASVVNALGVAAGGIAAALALFVLIMRVKYKRAMRMPVGLKTADLIRLREKLTTRDRGGMPIARENVVSRIGGLLKLRERLRGKR